MQPQMSSGRLDGRLRHSSGLGSRSTQMGDDRLGLICQRAVRKPETGVHEIVSADGTVVRRASPHWLRHKATVDLGSDLPMQPRICLAILGLWMPLRSFPTGFASIIASP